MRNIWITISILVVIFITVSLVIRQSSQPEGLSKQILPEHVIEGNAVVDMFEFGETEYDFGIIKQSGDIVQHKFPFIYNGAEVIRVMGVPTSCACTSAEIDKDTLELGDTATITVLFDPNLHAEPEGKFFKSINLLTEPKIEDTPELKIWVEIDLDLGTEAYKLQMHND